MKVTNNPKDELIEQIQELTGSQRADKGKKHNYPKNRQSVSPSKMSIYKSVINRLISQGQEPSLDDNGYYIDTDTKYSQVYDNSNVKYVRKSRAHDFEKYRFEAWQESAYKEPNTKVWSDERFKPDLLKWAIHCSGMSKEDIDIYYTNKNMSILDLFCSFYHINPSDILFWTYDLWREYYECTPRYELEEDFKFTLGIKPGTSSCHPEWAYVTVQKEMDKLEEEQTNKDKKVWSTKLGHQNRRKND